MRRVLRSVLVVGLCAVLAGALSGCGGGTVSVNGRLTKGGQPFKVGPKGRVTMTFFPSVKEAEGNNSYPAEVSSDGSFTVPGNQRKGIPAGKYKIAVEVLDPYPFGKDKLQGRFGVTNTPIEREVKGGDNLEIDVDKP